MTDIEKKDDIKLEVKKPGVEGDDKTAKIPKLNKPGALGEKKIVLNSGTDSAIKPSDATRIAPSPITAPPGAEETIQMDKSDVKDVPELAPTKKETDDATQKTIKPPAAISQTAKSKTIKLKPLKPVNATEDNQEETLSMDRDALLDQDMPSSLGAPKAADIEDEATIKIQKPTTQKPAHPTPSVPGAKETIKLRPSNATPPPPGGKDTNQETVSMSKKTIRLVPKKPGDTADDSTQKTAKPSAPTVKLGDIPPAAPAAAAPPPAPVAPSAQTVKMPEPAAQPPKASGGKKTLKLKATPKAPAAPPVAGGAPPALDATEANAKVKGKKGKKQKKAKEPKAPKEKIAGENPKAMMTIAAVFAFMLIAYYAWMTVGSWAEGEQDLTKNANVPGLSGTVKASR